MTKFELLQPYWLLLLPVIILWLRYQLKNPATLAPFIDAIVIRYPPLQQDFKSAKKTIKSNLNSYLLAVIFSLFSMALAQPISLQKQPIKQQKYQPVDLVLLVNTSVSMVIKDYIVKGQAISRLALAKTMLKDFINQYTGEKVALLLHANPPMLWLPLTSDKQAVNNAIQRINPAIGGRLSNLGASFDLVAKSFKQQGDKVVLLIADGSLQVGGKSPVVAAKQLADKGFYIYIIAMGAKADLTSTNKSTHLLFEPVNLQALKQITATGNGQLFHAQNQQMFDDALKVIETKHQKIISSESEIKTIKAWYPYFLWIALILMVYVFSPRVKS